MISHAKPSHLTERVEEGIQEVDIAVGEGHSVCVKVGVRARRVCRKLQNDTATETEGCVIKTRRFADSLGASLIPITSTHSVSK